MYYTTQAPENLTFKLFLQIEMVFWTWHCHRLYD